MDGKFIRERLSFLRTKKKISEYKMSLDLGHSKTYIQSISSGKALPSMSEFLYICEYLGVSPKQFFDDEIEEPILVQKLYKLSRNLPDDDLAVLISTAERFKRR